MIKETIGPYQICYDHQSFGGRVILNINKAKEVNPNSNKYSGLNYFTQPILTEILR